MPKKSTKASKKKSTPKKKKPAKKKTTTKRKTTKKGRTTKIKYESTKEIKVDKILVDNFVMLQKVLVNLSSKFDDLTKQISKLLDLFEISAKSLAQKDTKKEKEDRETKKIMDRLDNISQQAGLIGKGLSLIHDVNKEQERPTMPTTPKTIAARPPTPRPPARPRQQGPRMQGYQPSISSRVREENA